MTREDVEKAAKHTIDEYNLNPEYGSYFEHGFIDGAEWRIKSVWHDSTEKPMTGQLLLVRTLYGGFDLCYYGVYVWNTVMTWVYMKDLIPNTED